MQTNMESPGIEFRWTVDACEEGLGGKRRAEKPCQSGAPRQVECGSSSVRAGEQRITAWNLLHARTGPPQSSNRCGWRPIGFLGTTGAWPAGPHQTGTTRVPLSGPAVNSCACLVSVGIQASKALRYGVVPGVQFICNGSGESGFS